MDNDRKTISRKSAHVSLLLFWCSIVFMTLLGMLGEWADSPVLMIICFIAAVACWIAAFAVRLTALACPYCGKSYCVPGWNRPLNRFCTKCGGEFHYETEPSDDPRNGDNCPRREDITGLYVFAPNTESVE